MEKKTEIEKDLKEIRDLKKRLTIVTSEVFAILSVIESNMQVLTEKKKLSCRETENKDDLLNIAQEVELS